MASKSEAQAKAEATGESVVHMNVPSKDICDVAGFKPDTNGVVKVPASMAENLKAQGFTERT